MASALALLESVVVLEHNFRLPRLLKHDPESHVIVMTDLGDLPSLSEIFSALGGYRQDEAPPNHERMAISKAVTWFPGVGTKVGGFLAALHSLKTIESIKRIPEAGFEYVPNSDLRTACLEIAIKSVPSQLSLFPDILLRAESERLYASMEETSHVRYLPLNNHSFLATARRLPSSSTPPPRTRKQKLASLTGNLLRSGVVSPVMLRNSWHTWSSFESLPFIKQETIMRN